MSLGLRDHHEPMTTAISNALSKQTLLFAAASNDGGNSRRAFPAAFTSVFCIHSTDGQGNSSGFNPTAKVAGVNFSLLGEHVRSDWPAGVKGINQSVNTMSGTSVATPIAAGLAASILCFVDQQDQQVEANEPLRLWLKEYDAMERIFMSMAESRRDYHYIRPHALFSRGSTRNLVYEHIRNIRRNMYQ
jgi:hypothetical protein